MYAQFITIFIFLLVGIVMVPLLLLVGKILRPHKPDPKKLATYECGEVPVGGSWIQFNLRFYVIAIVFLIFEVEVILLLPIATIFKSSLKSSTPFIIFGEIALFIAILLVGFAYAWYKGDLEWIRPSPKTLPDRKHVTP